MSRPERIRTTRVIFFAVLPLLISFPRLANAAEIEQVRFVDAYRLGRDTLELSNLGLMRYKGLLKAMVAGLYLPPGIAPTQALSDIPKRLEIEYFWSLRAKDIVKASDKLLADNVDETTLRKLRPQIERIHSLYEDVRPGDRYALTYLPGRGTFLSLNGKSKGMVPGADFAAAYFAIWLGQQPMDEGLKQQLLRPRP